MKKNISPALIMFFLVIPFVVYAGGRWYDNGTLHSASIAEWNREIGRARLNSSHTDISRMPSSA